MKRRWLSILLVCGMMLTMLPFAAFAEDGEPSECVCTEACTVETQNADCPICGAEDAAPEDCAQYETDQENHEGQASNPAEETPVETEPQSETQAVQSDKPVAVQATNAAHQHCYCGGNVSAGDHTSHSSVSYQPWNGPDSITYNDDGVAYVYLTEDATLPGKNLEVTGGNHLYLCLNGHTLISDGTHKITVNAESQLTISDCAGGGTIQGATTGWGGMCIFIYKGTVDLFGGKLTGGKVTKSSGGGAIAINDTDGVLNLYGGEITGNDGNQRGGGIYLMNGTLNMYGGSIHDNTAGNDSGNLYIASGTTMNVYGGVISGTHDYDINCWGTIQNPDPSKRGTSIYCGIYTIDGNVSGCTYYRRLGSGTGNLIGNHIFYWLDYYNTRYAQQNALPGRKFYPPDEPSKAGYTFTGWYDSKGNKFDFETVITNNITLFAGWTHNDHADENNDHKCDTCDEIISEHTGGTATCTEKAKCTTCGQEYGELDAQNHTDTTEWIQTAETHMQKYRCCGAIVVAEEAHEWQDGVCTECRYVCQHSGGTATCLEQAVCQFCGMSYGDVDPDHHVGHVQWNCDKDSHELEYTCCGLVTESDAHQWKDGVCTECGYHCQHSGGKATQTKRAVCDICGSAYGKRKKASSGAEQTATKTETKKAGTPKTGDNSEPVLWIVLLAASGGAVVGMTALRKKGTAKEN